MKLLIVLVSVFGVSLLILQIINDHWQLPLAGRIGISAMLLFTAIGHFAFFKGIQLMLPDFVPYKKAVIILTGVIEIGAAIGLLIPAIQQLTGWLLLFFLLILPANISAVLRQVDYQKGTMIGPGPIICGFGFHYNCFYGLGILVRYLQLIATCLFVKYLLPIAVFSFLQRQRKLLNLHLP